MRPVRPQDPANVAKGVLTTTRSLLGVISQRCGQDRRLSRRNAKRFQAGSSDSQEGRLPQIPALDPQDPGLARSVRPKRATNIEQERHEASSLPRLRGNRPISPGRCRPSTEIEGDDLRGRNVASVLRKLGMEHEGRLRHTLLLRDGWRDSDVYSILEPKWSTRQPRPLPTVPDRRECESASGPTRDRRAVPSRRGTRRSVYRGCDRARSIGASRAALPVPGGRAVHLPSLEAHALAVRPSGADGCNPARLDRGHRTPSTGLGHGRLPGQGRRGRRLSHPPRQRDVRHVHRATRHQQRRRRVKILDVRENLANNRQLSWCARQCRADLTVRAGTRAAHRLIHEAATRSEERIASATSRQRCPTTPGP